MDILGALPLELSNRVLKYLTPAESILLRLVSKSYHDLLTSEEVCSSLSHHFIKHEYNAAKKLDSWRLHYENHVSRRLSYASGKPWVTEVLPRMRLKSYCLETSCLAGMPDADWDSGIPSVQVLDLSTYPAEVVFPPTPITEGNDIEKVILLPSFVVAVTVRGPGYSWNLKTHQVYRFEVPRSSDIFTPIDGNGDLIVITLRDLVIVHDLQAEKASSFNLNIGEDARIWKGAEGGGRGWAVVIVNAENRVVWLLREAPHEGLHCPWPDFVIDSLSLEAGGIVRGGIRSIPARNRSYCGDGLWKFWDARSFSCHPGPAQKTTEAQVKWTCLDAGTGALTEEAYTITFPRWVTGFNCRNRYPGPIPRFDGLGCFVEQDPCPRDTCPQVWMLDQEPGSRVARARLLDLSAVGYIRSPWSIKACIGLCDKFVLLGDRNREAIVARFKGIHDSER